MSVKVGTEFRYTYADGNCLWTVIEKRGRGTWLAEINADEPDYAGTQGAFTTEQIEGSIRMSNFWKKTSSESDTFFKGLQPGSVVHYNNGGNQFVRCQVMPDKQLMPIALVGDWREYDLPRRQRNGEIDYGYHAKTIIEHKTFQPHASNVWEFNVNRSARQQPINFSKQTDPRGLSAICLSVPPMTVKQGTEAEKWKKLDLIRNIVGGDNEPETIFASLKKILETT